MSKLTIKGRLQKQEDQIFKKPVNFWNSTLRTDQAMFNLSQSDGKREVWKREGAASSVKHGGGSVMAWACVVAMGSGSLVAIDVAAEKSGINLEVHIFAAQVQTNAY